MNFLISTLMLISRLCIAPIFVFAGISKLLDYDQTAQYMISKGFTMVPFFLFGASAVEILAGLALIFGFKTRWAAFILAVFLIPTTLIFHDFWMATVAEKAMQEIMFFKNLAIFGGLLYIVCHGAGKCACDACKSKQVPLTHPSGVSQPPQ